MALVQDCVNMDEVAEIDDFLNNALSDGESSNDVDDFLGEALTDDIDEALRYLNSALDDRESVCSEQADDTFQEDTQSSGRNDERNGIESMEFDEETQEIVDDFFDENGLSEDEVSPELKRILSPNKAVFSINGYRRRTMSLANLTSTAQDFRCSASLSSCSYDSETNSDQLSPETLNHHDHRKQIKNLQASLQQEQAVLTQVNNALNQCNDAVPSSASLAAQVECNKLLLVASRRHQAILGEIERLRSQNSSEKYAQEHGIGSLTISDIQLPMTREFMDTINSAEDCTEHYFILLLKYGAQVFSSQMISTHIDDSLTCGSLNFPNTFKLNNVPNDFRFELEVYSMQVDRDTKKPIKKAGRRFSRSNSRVKELISNVFGTVSPASKRRKSYPNVVTGIKTSESALRPTAFNHVTSLTISPESLKQINFFLQTVPFKSPLQGTVHMTMNSSLESNVVHSGFVNLMDDASGLGACRHRRWCVLEKDRLCFWHYPEDQDDKDPVGIINLKECVSAEIDQVSRTLCARSNTIEITTVKSAVKKPGTMTMSRHQDKNHELYWIILDTTHERVEWIKKLNTALKNIRQWSVDAVRPLPTIRSSCIY